MFLVNYQYKDRKTFIEDKQADLKYLLMIKDGALKYKIASIYKRCALPAP